METRITVTSHNQEFNIPFLFMPNSAQDIIDVICDEAECEEGDYVIEQVDGLGPNVDKQTSLLSITDMMQIKHKLEAEDLWDVYLEYIKALNYTPDLQNFRDAYIGTFETREDFKKYFKETYGVEYDHKNHRFDFMCIRDYDDYLYFNNI